MLHSPKEITRRKIECAIFVNATKQYRRHRSNACLCVLLVALESATLKCVLLLDAGSLDACLAAVIEPSNVEVVNNPRLECGAVNDSLEADA